MEHRLRRKQLNSGTNASFSTYLKEIQEKRKEDTFFLRKKRKKKKKNNKFKKKKRDFSKTREKRKRGPNEVPPETKRNVTRNLLEAIEAKQNRIPSNPEKKKKRKKRENEEK